jgi:hypothetical protein
MWSRWNAHQEVLACDPLMRGIVREDALSKRNGPTCTCGSTVSLKGPHVLHTYGNLNCYLIECLMRVAKGP